MANTNKNTWKPAFSNGENVFIVLTNTLEVKEATIRSFDLVDRVYTVSYPSNIVSWMQIRSTRMSENKIFSSRSDAELLLRKYKEEILQELAV